MTSLAYRLSNVAADILERAEHVRAEMLIKDVVFVDHLEIEPEYRGRRITRWLLDDLMDALRLDERTTLVVMDPEPGGWGSGRLSPGADRDAARDRLLNALREQGIPALGRECARVRRRRVVAADARVRDRGGLRSRRCEQSIWRRLKSGVGVGRPPVLPGTRCDPLCTHRR